MNISRQLAAILGDVSRPGDYFVSGRAEFPAPRIEVDGVGPVALPLLPVQAKQLIKAASRAPYGRGSDTIIDTKVRRSWQIEADRVRIAGKHWPQTLAGIVARAAAGLGVTEPVSAELYKLLIYDKGSFFVSHRDTEKAPGMFATLVVTLPSQSEGGELVVRHNDREVKLELRCEEPSEIAFAAFYADCLHEVLPVSSGCRATLVFNLKRTGKGAALQPPAYDAEASKVAALLTAWTGSRSQPANVADDYRDAGAGNSPPEKLVYPLEHAYTPAELAFDRLKGADAAVARLLAVVAPDADCDLHLALLTFWESGSAEYHGSYRRRSWRRDDDEDSDESHEFEVIEVFDWEKSLTEWRRSDGIPTTLGKLPIEDGEIFPAGALDGMKPDEEHFREATGNEGASFDRTYRRAALVLWPKARILAVLNQAGIAATLPYLDELLTKSKAAGAAKGSRDRQQAHELAGHMLSTWPERTSLQSRATPMTHARNRAEFSELGRMLGLLARLGDKGLVEAMIGKLIVQQGHDAADNAAILKAIGLFPLEQAAGNLQRIVEAGAVDALGACGALLAEALKGAFTKKPALLLGAAAIIISALPGDPASAPKDQWGRPRVSRPDAAFVAAFAAAVDRIDDALAQRAAAHVLAWPQHFDADRVLVPAVKRLRTARTKTGTAVGILHAASVAHLEARVALPLEAPKDWVRPNPMGCRCTQCSQLSRFLADASSGSWALKAVQQVRTHVEAEITRAKADVTMHTERRGSPHQLICTKNQASYERRVVQRKHDLADLLALTG